MNAVLLFFLSFPGMSYAAGTAVPGSSATTLMSNSTQTQVINGNLQVRSKSSSLGQIVLSTGVPNTKGQAIAGMQIEDGTNGPSITGAASGDLSIYVGTKGNSIPNKMDWSANNGSSIQMSLLKSGSLALGTTVPDSTFNVYSGSITSQSIGQIFYASEFPGADLGAQINNALAAFGSGQQCGTIILPFGVFRTSTTVNLSNRSGCIIRGIGGPNIASGSSYYFTGSSAAFETTGFDQYGSQNQFRDFRLNCDVSNGCGAGSVGILLTDSHRTEITGMEFTNWPSTGAGVRLTNSAHNAFSVYIHNNDFQFNSGNALDLQNLGAASAQISIVNIDANDFHSNSGYGIQITSEAYSINIENNHFGSNSLGAIWANGLNASVIEGNYFESNGGDADIVIGTQTVSDGILILGNTFDPSLSNMYCVDIASGVPNTNFVIMDNQCFGAATAYNINQVIGGFLGPNAGNVTNYTLSANSKMSVLSSSGVWALSGTTDGSSAAAGFVGEYGSTTPAVNPSNFAASTLYVTIATTTLAPGDYDERAIVQVNFGGTSAFTQICACISDTKDTCTDNNDLSENCDDTVPNVSVTGKYLVGSRRKNVSSNTAQFLTVKGIYTTLGGALISNNSTLSWRRMR